MSWRSTYFDPELAFVAKSIRDIRQPIFSSSLYFEVYQRPFHPKQHKKHQQAIDSLRCIPSFLKLIPGVLGLSIILR